MKNLAHLTHEEMVQSLDGELGAADRTRVETHLANCDECLDRYEKLAELSGMLSHAIETVSVAVPAAGRQQLQVAMEQQAGVPSIRSVAWWKWAAIAAGLLLTLLLFRHRHSPQPETIPQKTQAQVEPHPTAAPAPVMTNSPKRHPRVRATMRETQLDDAFIRLPYSDPSLPINSTNIVRVEIPLSALASTGIVRARPGIGDPLIKADVLLGLDGQPSGIRLVSAGMTAK